MAAQQSSLNPPKVLRAHRPKHPDTQTPLPADVQEHYVYTEDLPQQPGWIRQHLFHISLGMLFMLALWYAGTTYVLPFVQNTLNHWNCGANLICQYDLDVGHNGGKSHFLTEYYNHQVIVIELEPGHPEHTKLYAQSVFSQGDTSLHLVSLTTAYLTRHPIQGKPDLVASVSGFSLPVIFYNTGSSFSTEEPR